MAQLQASTVAGTLTTTGNVGINTTSTSIRLLVANVPTYDAGIIASGNTTNGVGVGINNANGNSWYLISTGAGNGGGANNLGFYNATQGEYRVYFTGNGNVGIGTVTPTQALDVRGAIYSLGSGTDGGQIRVQNSGGGNAWYWAARTTGLNLGQLGVADARMFVNNDGNVGIGTATPTDPLTIGGGQTGLSINSVTSGDPYVRWRLDGTVYTDAYVDRGTGNFIMGPSVSAALVFKTNATEKVRITSGGNVGISTANPQNLLHIWNGTIEVTGFQSAGSPLTFLESNYNSVDAVKIRFLNYNPSNGLDSDLGIQVMNTGGSMVEVITAKGSTGNVGIGTDSPAFKLDVNGTGRFNGQLRTTQGGRTLFLGDGSFANHINVDSNVDFAFNYNNGNPGGFGFFAGGTTAKFFISNSGDVTARKIWLSTNGATDATTAILANASTNDSTSYAAIFGSLNAGYRMVVRADGDVGIGTTSPSNKVHIYDSTPILRIQGVGVGEIGLKITDGNSDTAGITYNSATGEQRIIGAQSYVFQTFYSGNAERMRITSGGDVGIGTTNPNGNKLQVNGRIYTVGTAAQANAIFQGGQLEFYKDATPTYAASIGLSGPSSGGTNDIVFETYGGSWSERMRIATGGNVGIGITNPGAKLDVNGDLKFSKSPDPKIYAGSGVGLNIDGEALYLNRYTTSNILIVAGGGNVGIGTNNPGSYKLNVNGQSAFQDNVTIGSDKYLFTNNISANTNFADLLITGPTNADIVLNGSNVGIGTNNPAVKLQVVGANTAEGQLYVGNTDVTYSAGINFTTSGANRGFVGWRHTNSGAPFSLTGVHLFNTDNSNLVFGTNNLVRAVINVNGNVGIGITNPYSQLSLNNQISGGTSPVASYTAGSGIGLGQNFFNSYYVSDSDGLGTYPRYFDIVSTGYPDGTNGGSNIRFFTNPIALNSPAVERMRIASTGNVGIGTTNPINKLHVAGGLTVASTSTDGRINFGSADTGIALYRDNTYDLVLQQNEASGNPVYIAGAGNVVVSIDSNDNQTDRKFIVGSNAIKSSNELFSVDEGGNGYFSGNVGIGTASSVTSPLRVQGGDSMTGGWNKNTMLAATYPVLLFNSLGKYAGIGYDYSAALRIWINAGTEDVTATTPVVNILNTGNVGIGTASPGYQLDVKPGTASATLRVGSWAILENVTTDQAMFSRNAAYNTSAGSGWRTINTGGATAIRMYDDPGDPSIGFHLHSSEAAGTSLTTWDSTDVKMTLRNNGNLGIGTATPLQKLHVYQASSGVTPYPLTGGINIESNSITGINILSPNTGYGRIYFSAPVSSTVGAIEYIHSATATSGYMKFRTGDVDRMFILGDGNVGIGTATPSKSFTVVSPNNNVTTFAGFYAQNVSQAVEIWYGGIQMGGSNTNVALNLASKGSESIVFLTNSTEKMRIISDGNIGIGTDRPHAQLHINSGGSYINTDSNNRLFIAHTGSPYILFSSPDERDNGIHFHNTTDNAFVGRIAYYHRAAGDAMWFRVGTPSGDGQMVLISTGNVGIGTDNPARRLDVREGNVQIVANFQSTSTTSSRIKFTDANTGAENVNIGATGTSLAMWTNNTVRMTILSGGNVGINTATPTHRLHVNGTLRVDNAGSAPDLKGGTPPENYVGGTGYWLGEPSGWLAINVGGTPYVIPLYE